MKNLVGGWVQKDHTAIFCASVQNCGATSHANSRLHFKEVHLAPHNSMNKIANDVASNLIVVPY